MIDGLKPYPEYKDSGLPWVGAIPSHWSPRRGKALFSESRLPVRDEDEIVTCFRDGQVTLRRNRRTSGFMMALYETGYQGVRKGQLVIHAMDAFAGAIGVSDSDGKCTPEYIVVNPRSENALPGYFALLLRFAAHQGFILVSCPAVRERAPRFRYPSFGNMQMPLPPLDEQAVIVRFLGHSSRRIDIAIRAKNKLIALLNEQKRAIIHQAVTRGIDPNVPLKPSSIPWLGSIPDHWSAISVGAATTLIQTGPFGSQLHSQEYVTGGTPVINPSHMQGGRIIPDLSISVNQAKVTELRRHQVCTDDIVAARRGELGRCALVSEVEKGWLCGTGSLLIRCKPEVFSPAYFQQVFSSQGIRDSLSLASVGATMDNLNAGMVARLRMPLPPLSEQHKIVEVIESENQRHEMTTLVVLREIDLLREYRTRLIADVLTGKLDVRIVASHLPEEAEESATMEADNGDVESEPELNHAVQKAEAL